MRLVDIEQEIYGTGGHGENPDQEVVARVRRSANIVYRELMARKGLEKLRRKVLPFLTISLQPLAVLPQAATIIHTISDRTNQWVLSEIDLKDLRYDDPALNASASYPYEYVVLNYASPIAQPPSAAAELFVKSDSASDGSGVAAYLNGIETGGYPRQASINMNGTTAVSLDAGITDWIDVTKFYVSAAAKGNITLRQGSGAGTELARITPGRTFARYTQIHLHPTPTGVATLYADVDLLIEDLINSNDEPVFWEDFHWLIPCGILMREYNRPSKKEPGLYNNEKARWMSGIAELKLRLSKVGGLPQGPHRRRNWSQLGPWFPAGS